MSRWLLRFERSHVDDEAVVDIGAVLQLAGSLVVAAETTRLADITYELGRDQAKLLERIAASL